MAGAQLSQALVPSALLCSIGRPAGAGPVESLQGSPHANAPQLRGPEPCRLSSPGANSGTRGCWGVHLGIGSLPCSQSFPACAARFWHLLQREVCGVRGGRCRDRSSALGWGGVRRPPPRWLGGLRPSLHGIPVVFAWGDEEAQSDRPGQDRAGGLGSHLPRSLPCFSAKVPGRRRTLPSQPLDGRGESPPPRKQILIPF